MLITLPLSKPSNVTIPTLSFTSYAFRHPRIGHGRMPNGILLLSVYDAADAALYFLHPVLRRRLL